VGGRICETLCVRHRYVCPIRWADLDQQGHVNNVRYVDYLQEARVDMLRAHRWAGGGDDPATAIADGIIVVRHQVTYLAPLLFGPRPVLIECWVTDLRSASFTMAYEIFHEDETTGDRTVYVRALTVLAPYRFDTESPRRLSEEERAALAPYVEQEERRRPERIRVDRGTAGRYQVQVRFSDVDVYRHVNNVVYFEYFQEARIRLVADALGGERPSDVQVVVAQIDVDYLSAITLRPEPYDCWTQVRRVGTRSMTIESEIGDGERALARARVVLVFFDAATQRATEPPAAYKERLLQYVVSDAG
jgi:acyl-CoA thioester hydrolase